jgi:hypothetical protein
VRFALRLVAVSAVCAGLGIVAAPVAGAGASGGTGPSNMPDP